MAPTSQSLSIILFCSPAVRWLLKVNSSSFFCITIVVTNKGNSVTQIHLNRLTTEAVIRPVHEENSISIHASSVTITQMFPQTGLYPLTAFKTVDPT